MRMPKKKISEEISKEVLKKESLELQMRIDLARHKQKMKELAFLRESDRLHYKQEAEKEEMKREGIKETLDRKKMLNDSQHYYNG